MLKQVDMMSIIIIKYKKMFADASRKRERERDGKRERVKEIDTFRYYQKISNILRSLEEGE